jgi:hypothetical protein
MPPVFVLLPELEALPLVLADVPAAPVAVVPLRSDRPVVEPLDPELPPADWLPPGPPIPVFSLWPQAAKSVANAASKMTFLISDLLADIFRAHPGKGNPKTYEIMDAIGPEKR